MKFAALILVLLLLAMLAGCVPGPNNMKGLPGDKVSVVILPLKDGSKGGTFLRCTLADGTVMVMFALSPQ